MSIRYLTLTIGPSLAGLEVNTLLRRNLFLSGTVLRRVKRLEDGICLDGVRVNVRTRVEEGQTLSVRLTIPGGIAHPPIPAAGPLDIVHEDADLVVINKAPGILVHPGHGHFNDTVGNFLMDHYRQTGEDTGFHPVHRLDKGTSGLLVIAKHPHSQEQLKILNTPITLKETVFNTSLMWGRRFVFTYSSIFAEYWLISASTVASRSGLSFSKRSAQLERLLT